MKILLGVTGGIAAYKSPLLVRELRKRGAQVRVVMSRSARQFVTPATLQALSGHRVRDNLFDAEAEAAMGHIELARWADRIVIAPATADVLARLAQGRADDLMTTLCLASKAPIVLAPAMNRVMWSHPATQANVEQLGARGCQFVGPDSGEQACGELGEGRMAEPRAIAGAIFTGVLEGANVLITAGPTREPIDPVRYISNRSSGRMGYALAAAARDAGANVHLVSGPVALDVPEGVQVTQVETALQMQSAVQSAVPDARILIAAAAVSDYRPAQVPEQKIKRSGNAAPELDLVENPDIVAAVAACRPKPFVCGFAAETQNWRDNGQSKLKNKGLDMIAVNDVSPGAAGGFDSANNALTVLWHGGEQTLSLRPKDQIASDLIQLIAKHYAKGRN